MLLRHREQEYNLGIPTHLGCIRSIIQELIRSRDDEPSSNLLPTAIFRYCNHPMRGIRRRPGTAGATGPGAGCLYRHSASVGALPARGPGSLSPPSPSVAPPPARAEWRETYGAARHSAATDFA